MRTVIVIPAYNEVATMRDVVTRALAQCPDVVVIDDGSTDGTAQAVDGLPVTLIRHERNQGKAASLWDGFAVALAKDAQCVVTLDADGQHRPEDVPRMLAGALRHPQRIVIGARLRGRANAPLARRLANGAADFFISWAAGEPIADSQSGQRAYPAALLRALTRDPTLRHDASASFALESELLIAAARCGHATVAVPIDTTYTTHRASHFRAMRDIAGISRIILAHLFATRLNPAGLWRTLTSRPLVIAAETAAVKGDRAPLADTISRG